MVAGGAVAAGLVVPAEEGAAADVAAILSHTAFADGSLMNESKKRSRTARLVKMAGASAAAKTNKTTAVHLSSASVETKQRVTQHWM